MLESRSVRYRGRLLAMEFWRCYRNVEHLTLMDNAQLLLFYGRVQLINPSPCQSMIIDSIRIISFRRAITRYRQFRTYFMINSSTLEFTVVTMAYLLRSIVPRGLPNLKRNFIKQTSPASLGDDRIKYFKSKIGVLKKTQSKRSATEI